MTSASGANELWRRVALVLGILVGLALFCYVAPAMVSLTALDWEEEQAGELKSYSGYVTEEEKRLNSLPLDEYIAEKTGGQVTDVDGAQWGTFFQQVQLASNAEYKSSQYGSRVSEEDKDDFWKPTRPVEVFFKPDEIPYSQWGLRQSDSQTAYISTDSGSETIYLRLKYHDYKTSVSAMSSPYRTAPGWLYHPYRTIGIIIMILGLLLYIFLPRRKKQPDDISYSTGSMLAGDLVGDPTAAFLWTALFSQWRYGPGDHRFMARHPGHVADCLYQHLLILQQCLECFIPDRTDEGCPVTGDL